MTLGPMQLLVVGFEGDRFDDEILPALRSLHERDVARLVELLVIAKAADGSCAIVESSDLPHARARELAAIATGLADDRRDAFEEAVRFVADAIPVGTSAAIAVLEHRWAIPLRHAIVRAAGQTLADEWLQPSDLAQLGPALARAAARGS